jgi:RimJ/RimL family protein N-acetyltransferase
VTGYADVEWSTARVETARLLLRPLRPQDLDELRLLDEDGQLGYWAAATEDRETSWMRAAVTERSTGRLLGAADLCLDPWRYAATVRLEIWVAGWARRRGYGGEVVRSLSSWAFRHGMVRVELLAGPANEPAQRLALAGGFRREGQLRAALPAGHTRTDAIGGIARLELGTAVSNTASRRVAIRAGFQLEGVARMRLPTSDGGRTDEARFGLMHRADIAVR